MGSSTKFRNWESFDDGFFESNSKMENEDEVIPRCCKSPRIFFDEARAEKVCRNCGMVLKEREPIASLSTNQFKAKNPSTGSFRRYSKKRVSRDLQRALKMDRKSYEEKRVIIGITEIKRICSLRQIPEQTQKHAVDLFKKTMDQLKNKFIRPLAAICLYHYCAIRGYPAEMVEFVEDYNCSLKLVRKYYWKIVRMFGLKTPRKSAITYLPKTISELGLNAEVEKTATKLILKYERSKPCHSNSYKGIAAGAIYLVCTVNRLGITQKEIANQLDLSEITLRNRYNELKIIYKRFFL